MFAISSLLLSFFTFVVGLSCLDDTNKPTDTWTVIKAPQTGDSYLYATGTEELYQPSNSLNDTTTGALSYTLNQLWEADANYVLYNDSPPGSTSYNFSVGHTKGILAVDSQAQQGFYIVHSFPNWPAGPASQNLYGGLSSNLWTYGQNAYCLSINATTIDLLAYAFQLNVPNIYESKLSATVASALPNLTALVKGNVSIAPICAYHSFTTLGGKQHTIFSKSTQWNKDLWFSCVAPTLKKDLVVESWIRGSAIGPSCSSSYEVTDATEIDFSVDFTWSEYMESEPFHFLSEMDHSKWASSLDGSIACHGDINRMTTQYERGGGAVCFTPSYNLNGAVSKENSCQ